MQENVRQRGVRDWHSGCPGRDHAHCDNIAEITERPGTLATPQGRLPEPLRGVRRGNGEPQLRRYCGGGILVTAVRKFPISAVPQSHRYDAETWLGRLCEPIDRAARGAILRACLSSLDLTGLGLRRPVLQKALPGADSRRTPASPGSHKYERVQEGSGRGRELGARRHCRSHYRRHGCLCGRGAVAAREATTAKRFSAASAAPAATAFPAPIAAARLRRVSEFAGTAVLLQPVL
jgi:hypothetical protein